jgi:glyoxylase-like metal-dependent hydrolase (beta-lactamase superfamily II)
MVQQIPLPAASIADLSHSEHGARPIAPDLAYIRMAMVNVVLFGPPGHGDRSWILIDTGLPGLCCRITDAAAAQFGAESRPAAIILTHGHFDHVGCLKNLTENWDTPVFAHEVAAKRADGAGAEFHGKSSLQH